MMAADLKIGSMCHCKAPATIEWSILFWGVYSYVIITEVVIIMNEFKIISLVHGNR